VKKLILKKTTSIRAYQKMRKQVFLGLDDKGKKVYMGDFVRLSNRQSFKSPYISQIYWNALDGGFVDSHPAAIAMNCGKYSTTELAPFFRDKHGYNYRCIEKVTYKEYLQWQKSIEGKYDECRDANIKMREDAIKRFEQENTDI
jgi:hypothetical protein